MPDRATSSPEVTAFLDEKREIVRCCWAADPDGDALAVPDELADALPDGHGDAGRGLWTADEVGEEEPDGHAALPLGEADELADALALADAELLGEPLADADADALPLGLGVGDGHAGRGKIPQVGCAAAGASARITCPAMRMGVISAIKSTHVISATRAARLCMPILRKLSPWSAVNVEVTSYKSPRAHAGYR